MPVVTHTVETSTQADGSLDVTLRMFDQDGGEVGFNRFQLPVGTDVNTVVTNRINLQNIQLAESEFSQIVGL